MLKTTALLFVVMALLLGAAIGGSLVASFQVPIQRVKPDSSQQGREGTDKKRVESEPFWERAISDPAAFFTIVIAAFTIVLAAATIWLGISTRQLWISGEQATHVANRAWVFAAPSLTTIRSVISGERADWERRYRFQLRFFNYGKSPARVIEFGVHFSDAEPNGEEASVGMKRVTTNFPMGLPEGWTWPETFETYAPTVYVFGFVRYIDAFGAEHFSRYCGRLRAAEPPYEVAGGPYWSQFD